MDVLFSNILHASGDLWELAWCLLCLGNLDRHLQRRTTEQLDCEQKAHFSWDVPVPSEREVPPSLYVYVYMLFTWNNTMRTIIHYQYLYLVKSSHTIIDVTHCFIYVLSSCVSNTHCIHSYHFKADTIVWTSNFFLVAQEIHTNWISAYSGKTFKAFWTSPWWKLQQNKSRVKSLIRKTTISIPFMVKPPF